MSDIGYSEKDFEKLPFAPDAWIDEKKNVIGYEIPFTRYFYKYEAPKPSAQIMDEIKELEKILLAALQKFLESKNDEKRLFDNTTKMYYLKSKKTLHASRYLLWFQCAPSEVLFLSGNCFRF